MKAFSSKAKDLKMKGMGNKPKAAAPASDSEITMLFESGQLGTDTPASIINTLWLNNTLHFGMRGGGAEHRYPYNFMKIIEIARYTAFIPFTNQCS